MKLSNGVAGLGVSGGRNRAGVNDNDVGGRRRGSGDAATIQQLAFEGGAIRLRGAATELFDEESSHVHEPREPKHFTRSFSSTQRARKRKTGRGIPLGPKERG